MAGEDVDLGIDLSTARAARGAQVGHHGAVITRRTVGDLGLWEQWK
jgi:hypothetical protein